MEKYFFDFENKKYLVRNVDLSVILDHYTVENIGTEEFRKALSDADDAGYDVSDYDNEIYCYLDTDFMQSDPTDAEILYAIIMQEGCSIEITEQYWYNLMRLAGLEINQMHSDGKINMNAEGYECGGRYSVYAYNGNVNYPLYDGKDAKVATECMIAILSTIRLMQL